MSARRLLDDEAFRIELGADRICRIARTHRPFLDLRACMAAHERVATAVGGLGEGGLAIFDVRLAPARNDPEFEGVVTALTPRMFRPFARVAFLVKSAAGQLHVRRLTRAVPGVEAFLDEEAALGWLRRGPPRA